MYILLYMEYNKKYIHRGGNKDYQEIIYEIAKYNAMDIQATKKLYQYDAWGGRDSNANGFIILDSSEIFKIDLQNELPFYNLSDIPNKTKIVGITHDCYNSCGSDYYKNIHFKHHHSNWSSKY